MTTSKNNKRRPNQTSVVDGDTEPAAGSSKTSRISSHDLLNVLAEVRGVVRKSVTSYEQVMERLNGQDQSILSIVEAIQRLTNTVDQSRLAAAAPAIQPLKGPHTATAGPESEATAEFETKEVAESSGVSAGDWADIRQAFLEQHGSQEPAPKQETTDAAPQLAAAVTAEEDDSAELDQLLARLPEAVDCHCTDVEKLQSGIVDRDRTISVLARRLQKRNRQRQTLSPEQLSEIVSGLPEDLANRVTESLELVTQQVRLGELELSLERARVSRQLSKLEDTKNRLESNARLLGLTIAEDGTLEGKTEQLMQQGSKGRRWLGVLGFGN